VDAQLPEAVRGWPRSAAELEGEQLRLGALTPQQWFVPDDPILVAGCFLAFARGEQGPGHTGDRGWVAAAVVECPRLRTVETVVVACRAGAPYDRGRLALREGPALASAFARLSRRPDVLMVDATGRDHPRRAGLALHLGAFLELPSVGVTHRPLLARGPLPGPRPGDTTPLRLHGETVGAWLRTRAGARPVAVHPGWMLDCTTAVHLTRLCTGQARTPEPLRQARVVARTIRAHAEARTI